MLYHLLLPLSDEISVLNLFRYLSFRTGGAILTALIISFLLGGPMIQLLKSKQGEGQPIRDDGPEKHPLTKKGTPTMGGFLILIALTISTLLWANLNNRYVWAVLFVTLGFGIIGFIDDYLKIARRSSHGLSGKIKIFSQVIIGCAIAWWISRIGQEPLATSLAIPFFKNLLFDLGWFFIPFAALVMIGASNAVNLTDGLDGLAIVPAMIVGACLALITYLVGNNIFASYLQIHNVPGAGELTIFCGALVGASLGFLWFNAPPAMIFMGDTGSLSVGGALGAVSVISKHELVLVMIGGLFVLETISVIVQVASYKITGRRIFRMAPLHHHFEKKGWEEPTIVIRFWILAVILALIGLSTLKVR